LISRRRALQGIASIPVATSASLASAPVSAAPADARYRNAAAPIAELPPRAFALWDTRMEEVIEPGVFDIGVGPDSANLKNVELRIV
jgi:hypothetical protein